MKISYTRVVMYCISSGCIITRRDVQFQILLNCDRPKDVTNSEHKLRQFSNTLTFYFIILGYMYRNRLRYAKSVQWFLGGKITKSLDPQLTLCLPLIRYPPWEPIIFLLSRIRSLFTNYKNKDEKNVYVWTLTIVLEKNTLKAY